MRNSGIPKEMTEFCHLTAPLNVVFMILTCDVHYIYSLLLCARFI